MGGGRVGRIASAIAKLKFSRVAAFCGLGEPRSFWRTLEELEIGMSRCSANLRIIIVIVLVISGIWRRLLGDLGVDALVTTEKDAMNLWRRGRADRAAAALLAENRSRGRSRG